MFKVYIFALFVMGAMSVEIINRKDWGAKPPKHINYINRTVPFVIIHHSAGPVCDSTPECSKTVLGIQKFHQESRGWFDIGYSFLVGGDGKVYEGRGFNVFGAHAPSYNDKSIGICLLGNWEDAVPSQNMLSATQELISLAINSEHLTGEYKLFGHRQVRSTECPGTALFNEIKIWPHFGYP